jgi:hypothetical protein
MRASWFIWLAVWGLSLLGLGGLATAAPTTAGQSAESAAAIILSYPNALIYGDQTNTSNFTSNANDPALSCLAGSPFNQRGYRSAWYKLNPPASGDIVLETLPNSDYRANYDTVIAVFVGTPGSLTEIACNDDETAFFSHLTLPVAQGQTYYIEVVSRDFSVGARPPVLNFRAELIPGKTWEIVGQLPFALTGHSVVPHGNDLYIVGGFTNINPTMGSGGDRSSSFYKYNTSTGTLTILPDMPASPAPGGAGYGYAEAAISRNLLHMPSGFVGTNGAYDGTHWVYDLTTNEWRVFSAANGQVDPPWGPPPGNNVPGWAAVLDHEFGLQRGIYVIGGLRGTFRTGTNTLPSANAYLMLDTGSGYNWLNLPNMSNARYAHTAVRVGRDVCVVGGLTVVDGGDGILSSGECYRPTAEPPGWYALGDTLTVPRFMAESALGPDGRWYVFGGIDATGNYVPQTEVYDFNSGTWSIIQSNYWLGSPALAWPRGGFVGGTLWSVGGQQQGGPAALPIIQRLNIFPTNNAPHTVYLPFIANPQARGLSLLGAIPIFPGQTATHLFQAGDAYHIYTFYLPDTRAMQFTLFNIPPSYDYDLLLYTSQKQFMQLSSNPGTTNEILSATLPAGQYYVLVANVNPTLSPSGQPYAVQFIVQ